MESLVPTLIPAGMTAFSSYLYSKHFELANRPQTAAIAISGILNSLRPHLQSRLERTIGKTGTDAVCFLTPMALIGLAGAYANLSWRVNLFVTGFFTFLTYQFGNMGLQMMFPFRQGQLDALFQTQFLASAVITEDGGAIDRWKEAVFQLEPLLQLPNARQVLEEWIDSKVMQYFRKVLEANKENLTNPYLETMITKLSDDARLDARQSWAQACLEAENYGGLRIRLDELYRLVNEENKLSCLIPCLKLDASIPAEFRVGLADFPRQEYIARIQDEPSRLEAELILAQIYHLDGNNEEAPAKWEEHQAVIGKRHSLFTEFVKAYAPYKWDELLALVQDDAGWTAQEERAEASTDIRVALMEALVGVASDGTLNQFQAWVALMECKPEDVEYNVRIQTAVKFGERFRDLDLKESAQIADLFQEEPPLGLKVLHFYLFICQLKHVGFDLWKREKARIQDATLHESYAPALKRAHLLLLMQTLLEKDLDEAALEVLNEWEFLKTERAQSEAIVDAFVTWLEQKERPEAATFKEQWLAASL